MNKYLKLSLIIPLLAPIFHAVKNNEVKTLQAWESVSSGLRVVHQPYVTTLSLGDSLYLDGLVVESFYNEDSEVISDYTISGYDGANLGVQTITLNKGMFSTSFEVYVTNDLVRNTPITSSELMISEFAYLNEGDIGIEIYNPTSSLVSLEDYALVINYDDSDDTLISLADFDIASKEAFTISNFASSSHLYDSASIMVVLELEGATSISLLKDDTLSDHIEIVPHASWFNSTEGTMPGNVIRRHYKTVGPNPVFTAKEWIFAAESTNDYGLHFISDAITSIAEQAKAFARYVMYGAGMFAAGRVEEAFLALKKEYTLMSNEAKQYFIDNKDIKVEGINEEGKRDTATFREAQGRISVLASSSGNPSFIPSTALSFNIEGTGGILILVAILSISTGGFLIIRHKSKKN
ncbi:MAG: bacterial Ig-like domain-containing protein [Bacilli bacterium]